jgi:selenocysteine-specific elongation factor
LGGGVVLSPHPRRRWRRFDPAVITRLETLAQGAPDEVLLQTLARGPLMPQADLLAQSGLDLGDAEAAYADLTAAGALVAFGQGPNPAVLSLDQWQRLVDRLTALLDAYHRQSPLRKGMPRSEVRTRLEGAFGMKISPRVFNEIVARTEAAALVETDDAYLWLAGFSPQLSSRQEQAVATALAAYAAAPYTPPNQGDTLGLLGGDEALLEMLIDQGTIVRFGGVLLRNQDFQAMRDAIVAYIKQNGAITLAETRDLFDTSRKYAQAVLEELDAQRVTRRLDDARVLRSGQDNG